MPSAAGDDHPFPYLLHRTIPTLYIGVLGAILLVTLVSVRLTGVRLRRTARYVDMFLLGAAFMLLETKNVIGFALYFGTTWLVNAMVFAGCCSPCCARWRSGAGCAGSISWCCN
ncbi:hypothetical protein SVIO_011160 [Streptomyces violaceusniger]|uniref:Uncharacterized protein n=1 Tax=Streptomyces violaceusniger TaxID=68280 RepID=A0A4D4KXH6_STRVO|nr:hypothetical protein SVIO_011160 [Streptomyces violaceusniger]